MLTPDILQYSLLNILQGGGYRCVYPNNLHIALTSDGVPFSQKWGPKELAVRPLDKPESQRRHRLGILPSLVLRLPRHSRIQKLCSWRLQRGLLRPNTSLEVGEGKYSQLRREP